MPQLVDLTGKTFGRWTVLEKSDKRDTSGNVYWLCQCVCGKQKVVHSPILRKTTSKTCVCKDENYISTGENIIGKQINKWTVLKFDKKVNGRDFYFCRCECGREKVVQGGNLRRGMTKCCGKCNTEDLYNGKKFGRWTILDINNKKITKDGRYYYFCECECGSQKFVDIGVIRRGRSVGCRKCAIKRGIDNPQWKGGRCKTPQGYIILNMPDHPNASKYGKVPEHVKIMSDHIKRPLRKGENVHHLNGIKDDNRIENLELWHKGQPAGQRVEDRIKYYKEFLTEYVSKEELIKWAEAL